jgi:hypothetical protein
MHTALLIIGLLACPLGMVALGGIAWASTRLLGNRAPRLTSVASRASCMSHGQPGNQSSTSTHEPVTTGNSR